MTDEVKTWIGIFFILGLIVFFIKINWFNREGFS